MGPGMLQDSDTHCLASLFHGYLLPCDIPTPGLLLAEELVVARTLVDTSGSGIWGWGCLLRTQAAPYSSSLRVGL